MCWLYRVFFLLSIIGLAILAALPYLPKIEGEVAHFYDTWKSIREGRGIVDTLEDPEPKIVEASIDRGRNLITPNPLNLETVSAEPAKDSFIFEARRRGKEDPTAAMDWLQSQHSGSERLRGMLEVVALWAAEDSESALLWLESNAQGLARLETLNNGVELWAERNPTEASQWIDGMANDGSKAIAAKALVAKWAESEPSVAAEWVAGLPNGPVQEKAKEALVKSWVMQDAKAASVWALAEAEFNGDHDLLGEAIREFSKQSPEEAESFVRDLAEANYSEIAVTSLVMGRAEEDPAVTAEWLIKMAPTDPIYSDEYTNELMQIWAETDSIAASEWLSAQNPGQQRDAAISGFSQSILSYEPEAAVVWASTISDPDRRMKQLSYNVEIWAGTQAAEALDWVQTAELEPAMRTHLANLISSD
jgi:hypothetical protein